MAVMGLRLAQRANGVSLLHGEVSREMFAGLWPGFDTAEVPIGSITNGVHAPTWVAREVLDLAGGPAEAPPRRSCRRTGTPGSGSRTPTRPGCGRSAARCAAGWSPRPGSGCAPRGGSAAPATPSWAGSTSVLDDNVLTIGFARRVPSYKRLTLMLHDPERLTALLLDPERPIQIVIAGKAHPADDGGKRLIQQMVKFADDPAGAAPHRVPARLRHGHGHALWCRAATSG